jgi:ABC-type sugar transport system substrate-binding protein
MTATLRTPPAETRHARSSRRIRPVVAGAVLAAGALLLTAACSSSSSSGSGTTSTSTGGSGSTSSASAQSSSLNAALQALEKNPAFTPPGPALDAKKLPASTPIVVIDNTPSVGPLEETSAGVMQAAQQAGFSPKLLNGGANNTASDDINLLEEAVNLHPKVVLQVGIITALETAGLQYAKSHGVPVIAVDDDAPVAGVPGEGSGPLASGTSAQDYTAYGQVLADYVAAQGPNNASVGIITSDDIVPSTAIQAAFTSELKKVCSGCTTFTQNVDTANWSTQITPTVTSILDAHPTLNYLFPVVDGMAPLVSPALSASSDSSLQVISANATPGSAMNSVKSGQFAAEVGASPEAIGWYGFDAALRVMLGLPQQTNPDEPYSFFTTSEMKAKNLDPNSVSALFGNAYQTGFLKLWGVSS